MRRIRTADSIPIVMVRPSGNATPSVLQDLSPSTEEEECGVASAFIEEPLCEVESATKKEIAKKRIEICTKSLSVAGGC
jgi:hypothetical protein